MARKPCPVCEGPDGEPTGVVPGGFYTPGRSNPETCRSCGGRKYVEESLVGAGPPSGPELDDPRDLTGS